MKSSSVLNRVQVGRRPEEQFAALRRPCCGPQQSEYRSYSRGELPASLHDVARGEL